MPDVINSPVPHGYSQGKAVVYIKAARDLWSLILVGTVVPEEFPPSEHIKAFRRLDVPGFLHVEITWYDHVGGDDMPEGSADVLVFRPRLLTLPSSDGGERFPYQPQPFHASRVLNLGNIGASDAALEAALSIGMPKLIRRIESIPDFLELARCAVSDDPDVYRMVILELLMELRSRWPHITQIAALDEGDTTGE